MAQIGWLIDMRRCTGCKSCTVACVMENKTDPTVHFRKVVTQESGTYPNFTRAFITMACNHCASPACMEACPDTVTAIEKKAGNDVDMPGAVLIDADKCVGCRHCEMVCPYGAPQYDEATQKMVKCTMCFHRLQQGLRPACETTCTGKAIRAFVTGDADLPTQYPKTGGYPNGFADPNLTSPSIRFILDT